MRLPRHPITLLLAFGLAVLMWYLVALDRRERLSERQLDASVTLVNKPPHLVITSEVPRSVVLHLRGPRTALQRIEPSRVGVAIDLRGAAEGSREYVVAADDLSVPDGIEVLAISPSRITLRLEPEIRRRAPLKVTVNGEPAAGFLIGAVVPDQPTVLVAGPRQAVERVSSVTTEPVTVNGVRATFETTVAVRSPHPMVRVEEPTTVRVQVGVIARHVEFKEGDLP